MKISLKFVFLTQFWKFGLAKHSVVTFCIKDVIELFSLAHSCPHRYINTEFDGMVWCTTLLRSFYRLTRHKREIYQKWNSPAIPEIGGKCFIHSEDLGKRIKKLHSRSWLVSFYFISFSRFFACIWPIWFHLSCSLYKVFYIHVYIMAMLYIKTTPNCLIISCQIKC